MPQKTMKNAHQHYLITKKAHARLVSVRDLLTSKNDLRGDLQRFLLEKENNNRSKATIDFYRWFVGWWIDFLEEGDITHADQLHPEYIMAYNQYLREDRKWQDVSVATSFRAIRAFCNWLAEVGQIKQEDYVHWRLEEPQFKKKKIKPFTELEIRGLLKLIENRPMYGHTGEHRKLLNLRDRAIILVYLDTGIRLREQSEILLSDIDLSRCIIKVNGKNGEERIVPFSPKTKVALTRYILHRGTLEYGDLHLWVNESGKPLTIWGLKDMFRRLKGLTNFESGVRVSSHTFRHTTGIMSVRNGMDTIILQEMLGHKSQKQTKEYLEYLTDDDVIKAHAKFSPVKNMNI
jgi:site-specific recombinase XerD